MDSPAVVDNLVAEDSPVVVGSLVAEDNPVVADSLVVLDNPVVVGSLSAEDNPVAVGSLVVEDSPVVVEDNRLVAADSQKVWSVAICYPLSLFWYSLVAAYSYQFDSVESTP